ncbi:MAG: hypothetical protein V8T10_00455 [Merdibacter sp.]
MRGEGEGRAPEPRSSAVAARRTADDVWNRYDALIDAIMRACICQGRSRYTLADRILLDPLLALPLCALFLLWLLQMVFTGSAPWSAFIMEVCDDYICPYLLYYMKACRK